jgi:antitoxin component YwqK of YwqJK toxin-antitoxin module
MYSYNSSHKIIVVFIVIGWAIFHFVSKKDQVLVYENGNPIRTGQTENNQNEGNWTWYHKNGLKQLSGSFKNGKREGQWIVYDTTGTMILKSNYINNLLNGPQITYGKGEEVLEINYFKNDKIVKTTKP